MKKENDKTTEEMRKGLQKCHVRFKNDLTFENVTRLTDHLFSQFNLQFGGKRNGSGAQKKCC